MWAFHGDELTTICSGYLVGAEKTPIGDAVKRPVTLDVVCAVRLEAKKAL